jgi:hypothetical protein
LARLPRHSVLIMKNSLVGQKMLSHQLERLNGD